MPFFAQAVCDNLKALYYEAKDEIETANEDQLTLIKECETSILSIDWNLHQNKLNLLRLE